MTLCLCSLFLAVIHNTVAANALFPKIEGNSTTTESYAGVDSTLTMFQPTVESLERNISKICGNHMKFVRDALNKNQSWAIHMLDSEGKQPSGMLYGGYIWLGDFDECLNIKALNSTQPLFIGQYCQIRVFFPRLKNPMFPQYPVTGQIAMCVPDTCTEQDTLSLAHVTLPQKTDESIIVRNAKCQATNKKLDTRAKAMLYTLISLVALVFIATTFDVIRRVYLKKPDQNTTLNNMEASMNGSECQKNGDRNDNNIKNDPDKTGQVHRTKKSCAETAGEILLAFSAYTNCLRVLSTHQGAGSLNAVNGIRFISMTWIILGHSYAYSTTITDNYSTAYPAFIDRRSFMVIINADLAVDTFFSISGLLVAYLTLKTMKKQSGRLNFFLYYFHRVWRLTPAYMLILTVYMSLFNYIGHGPLWGFDEVDRLPCDRFWWHNLLYINNFQTLQDQCLGWTWYLANDMQFYVISPILLLPLYRSKVAGTIVTIVVFLGTTILTGIISFNFDLGISADTSPNGLDFYDLFYVRPYCRIGPYIIGIYTGYLLYDKQSKCRIHKFLSLGLWTITAAIACVVLYGIYEETNGNLMSKELAAVYNAVHTSLWSFCVCWVVFACSTKHGGIVGSVLSWKGFIPLSRLSYSVYLIHPIIIYYYAGTRRRIIHWTDIDMIYMYIGHACLSFAIAVPVTLLFELPMMQLEKIMFKK